VAKFIDTEHTAGLVWLC